MLKKPLALLITISVLASVCILGVFAASESKPRYEFLELTFEDVAPEDDCYRFVRNVYENGLMNGKGHGMFDPAGNVTAAELITVAARLHAHYLIRLIVSRRPMSGMKHIGNTAKKKVFSYRNMRILTPR